MSHVCAGGVVKDQAEADKDMSIQQRVAVGVGTQISKPHMQHHKTCHTCSTISVTL